MNQLDRIHKFQHTLPTVRRWIEKTINDNKSNAVLLESLSFPKISKVFSPEILSKAYAVVVNEKVPFPPLSSMGLPEFSQMENMQLAGITYNDTFFVHHHDKTESLYFHELVHVIQWGRLGIDNYLMAYGIGLMQFGYRNSPFEEMAYSLQNDFDRGVIGENTVERIYQQTDVIWNNVSAMFAPI